MNWSELMRNDQDPSGVGAPDAKWPLSSPRRWHEAPAEKHSILDGFLGNLQTFPRAPAIVETDCCWTYGELFAASARVAHDLRHIGAQPGQAVLILATQSRFSAAAAIGAVLADCPYACVDTHTPASFAWAAARKTRARFAILVEEHADFAAHCETLTAHGMKILNLSDLLADADLSQPPADLITPRRCGDDILDYAFTSGTTGTPKILADSHRYRADVYRRWIDLYNIGPSDNLGVQSTFKYDAMFDIIVALSSGASATILQDEGFFDGNTWFATLRRQRITSLMIMASALRVALETGPKTLLLPALRQIIIIGESLSAHLLDLIRRRMPDTVELHNCFGISEALLIANRKINGLDPDCANSFDFEEDAMMEHDFRPLTQDGTTPAGRHVLRVGGPGVFSGYLDEAGEIAEPVSASWETSDTFGLPGRCGRRYLGRTGRAFVIYGHLVEPGEIEQALLKCQGVAAASCRLDPLRETIHCEVETTALNSPRPEALAPYLDRRLLGFIEIDLAREGLKGKRR